MREIDKFIEAVKKYAQKEKGKYEYRIIQKENKYKILKRQAWTI